MSPKEGGHLLVVHDEQVGVTFVSFVVFTIIYLIPVEVLPCSTVFSGFEETKNSKVGGGARPPFSLSD